MTCARRVVPAFGPFALVLLWAVGIRADDTGDAARRSAAVCHVGKSATITVGELEDRIAALPPFQRATFGDSAQAIRNKFFLEVLLPETLFTAGAEGHHLETEPLTRYQLDKARSEATIRAIRERIGPASSISMDDVRAYYADNRDRYDTPERYQVWRILCKTKDDAQQVLDAVKKDPTPKTFGELARQRSIDKSTSMRAGNLGFVSVEGTSNEPGLKFDPAIVRSAQTVHDGELVQSPVPEGDNFAVVWRRGTIPANKRSVEDVAAQIRDAIWKDRVKKETDKLVASLRAAKVHDLNDKLLDSLDFEAAADAGGISVRSAPVASH